MIKLVVPIQISVLGDSVSKTFDFDSRRHPFLVCGVPGRDLSSAIEVTTVDKRIKSLKAADGLFRIEFSEPWAGVEKFTFNALVPSE